MVCQENIDKNTYIKINSYIDTSINIDISKNDYLGDDAAGIPIKTLKRRSKYAVLDSELGFTVLY
jgi:hypothetical protein